MNQNIGAYQLHDFNGDARSDLAVHVVTTWTYTDPEPCSGELKVSQAYSRSVNQFDAEPNAIGCTYNMAAGSLAAVTVQTVGTTQVTFAAYGSWPSRPANLIFRNTEVDEHFADFNGDGTTDLLQEHLGNAWDLYLNTGTGWAPRITTGEPPNERQVQIADVNGDGRSDLLYWIDEGSRKVYVGRLGLATGGFAAQAPLLGNNAAICEGSGCMAEEKAAFFADLDGDAGLDFLSLRILVNVDLYVSRGSSSSRYQPREVITGFTNGLGAQTDVVYAPLTNAALYRRRAGTRNATN